MKTIKAGCFLVDTKTKSLALVYRNKQKDYSFPKGHLEKGEDLKQCAIREVAEETKRNAVILDKYTPSIEKYITSNGENCVCYMYIAIDNGPSDNTSTDTHDIVWTPFEKVEETLSYENLKKTWASVKDKIKQILD